MDKDKQGNWYRARHKVPPPEGEFITRAELQRRLRERIDRGDTAAEELWQRWRYVDRLFDVFRDKPLYTSEKENDMHKRQGT